ncbi:NINE protein [Chamaesiphon sp.]|uniref:NINE protein n=1 Tax=Chamaesiphon sp. TaxID=2814140 RepID=UPI003593C28D
MFDSTTPKNRQIAIVLAFASMATPIAGFHKFYLGQPGWGLVYLLLSWTPIPHIAAAIEAVWYLTQDDTHFGTNSNSLLPDRAIGQSPHLANALLRTHPVATISESIRELDKLRADGLISEYEFEQKRRQWLDRA